MVFHCLENLLAPHTNHYTKLKYSQHTKRNYSHCSTFTFHTREIVSKPFVVSVCSSLNLFPTFFLHSFLYLSLSLYVYQDVCRLPFHSTRNLAPAVSLTHSTTKTTQFDSFLGLQEKFNCKLDEWIML